MIPALLALAAAAAFGLSPAPAIGPVAAPDPAVGWWINPRHTLEVRTAPCGDRLCGTVVRATPEAMNDARNSGVPRLIGTQLLQEYRPTGRGQWSGRVYVPDMGRSFSSVIDVERNGGLKISGCLVGHLFCRSQTWTRAPHAD